jgi:hypothetical protein
MQLSLMINRKLENKDNAVEHLTKSEPSVPSRVQEGSRYYLQIVMGIHAFLGGLEIKTTSSK